MMLFTREQQQVVLNNRRAHQQAHERMQELHGNSMLEGNASPIPKDVWGLWDREAVELQRTILAVYNDLSSLNMAMPIAKLVHHFQTVTDSGESNISLDGQSSAKSDQQLIAYHGTPLPIIDSTFGYSWRQFLTAQSEGIQLDSAGRMNSMRRIAEKLESIVLDGDAKIKVGNANLYGLRNHPQRNQRTTIATLNGATGQEWLDEIGLHLKAQHAANFRVGATFYINWDDWFYASSTDFSAQYPNKTIAQRVMEVFGVDAVVPSNSINVNEIISVVKSREVVQILNGMPMTTRAKTRVDPEDRYEFKVMAAQALEIKFDADNNCGVTRSSK